MKKIIFTIVFVIWTSVIFSQYKMSIKQADNTTEDIWVHDIINLTFTNVAFTCGTSTITYAGQTYNTVLIGSQCWLKENLNVGTRINGNTNQTNNSTIEKYCYSDNEANCTTYGGLYLWDEAMQYVTTEGAQGICPSGWHMPKEAEYQTLKTFVGSDGNALKREDQGSGSGQGTNTSGFSSLLAGAKGYSGGPFQGLSEWSSFYVGKIGSCGYDCVYSMRIDYNSSTITLGQGSMPSWAFSVRCLKD